MNEPKETIVVHPTFTRADAERLRAMGDAIRYSRRNVDSEFKRTWADDLAERIERWVEREAA